MIEHRHRTEEMNAFVSIIPGVYDAIDGSDEIRNAFVFAAWRYVAGREVSERTSPAAVEGKKLVVAVADKTWKRNLESLAPQLLFRLNAALGKPHVDFLEFRIAPNNIRERERTNEDKVETSAPPADLSISAQRIRDENLREMVLKAAANCLSRHK